MRLLILGASGGCGRWLTRLAAERDHDVTVLLRSTSTFEDAHVRVLRGDVLDAAVLDHALEGQDAVACCVGIRWAGWSPWSALLSPPDLTTQVARALAPAMQRRGVRRVVALSAGGVAESAVRLTRPVRWVLSRRNLAITYADLAGMEAVFRTSSLDWLAVRPVGLTNGPPTGRVGPVARFGLRSTVRRADVAAWMLSALERPEPYTESSVMLGSVPSPSS